MAISVGKSAVDSGLYDLYEIENGKMQLTGASEKLLRKKNLPPVRDYFKLQNRFKVLGEEHIDQIQQDVSNKWAGYREEFAI